MIFVDPEDAKNPELAKENILRLCFASAIGYTIINIILLFIFKEKPLIPPT